MSSASPEPAALAALQAALAGEHAAVYAYGVVGARLPPSAQPLAARALASHATARDVLIGQVQTLGAQAVPAAPGYQLPFPVATPATAARLAATVEDRLAGLYVALASAATDGRTRSVAAAAVQANAVSAAAWRRLGGLRPVTEAFPGRPASLRPAPGPGSTG